MTRYTLSLWTDDMGTFTQPGCRDIEDALWHVNRAREHDDLLPIPLESFHEMLRSPKNSVARATLTVQA